MILNDATDGSIGRIFWFEKTEKFVSQEDADKIRQKAMSDMLYGALQSAMYSGANQSMDVNTAMQRGWREGNKQIDQMENGTEMKSEMFMIGDPNTIPRLIEIESNLNFRGWSNDYLISQIKNPNVT